MFLKKGSPGTKGEKGSSGSTGCTNPTEAPVQMDMKGADNEGRNGGGQCL